MRLAGSGEAHRRNGKAGGFGLPPFLSEEDDPGDGVRRAVVKNFACAQPRR
jgi:hypothetical protein